MCDDHDDKEVAITVHLNPRPSRCNAASGVDRRAVVTASRQPGGLAGGIDATHLHRHRGDTRQAKHQHHNQRGDRQCRLNGARAGTPG